MGLPDPELVGLFDFDPEDCVGQEIDNVVEPRGQPLPERLRALGRLLLEVCCRVVDFELDGVLEVLKLRVPLFRISSDLLARLLVRLAHDLVAVGPRFLHNLLRLALGLEERLDLLHLSRQPPADYQLTCPAITR